MSEPKKFTTNKVAALVEPFKSGISAIAEDLGSLRVEVSSLKEDMTEVKSDLITIKDAVRIALPSLMTCVTELEAEANA